MTPEAVKLKVSFPPWVLRVTLMEPDPLPDTPPPLPPPPPEQGAAANTQPELPETLVELAPAHQLAPPVAAELVKER